MFLGLGFQHGHEEFWSITSEYLAGAPDPMEPACGTLILDFHASTLADHMKWSWMS
jgi:hypothetical protein